MLEPIRYRFCFIAVALWNFFYDKETMKKTLTLSAWAVGGRIRAWLCALLAMTTIATHTPAHAIDNEGLTIIADASLMQPLRLITQHYARREQIGITLISDVSHYPVHRVSEGLTADIVITGNSQAHADIENMGLADQFATQTLAHEPMVLLRNPEAGSPDETNTSIAGSTTPTLVVLEVDNFPSITEMSKQIGKRVFGSDFNVLITNSHDEWYRTLKADNHFTMLPQAIRTHYPALALVRNLDDEATHSHIQGDVLAGTRMSESRALLAFLAGPDAAKVWRKFHYKPESY